jgi:lysophospholipase L1-like esterase
VTGDRRVAKPATLVPVESHRMNLLVCRGSPAQGRDKTPERTTRIKPMRSLVVFQTLLATLLLFPLPVRAAQSEPRIDPSAAPGVADSATYLQGVSTEMAKQWPANRTINIVCHGHSVPAGYFKTPVVDTFNAYPHLFHRGLKERFPFAVLNVIVTAIGGENSESGAERFARDVLSLRPDVVTIDYALNDRGIGLDRAKAAWRKMIEQARAAGVRVILLTPTPDIRANLSDPSDPLNRHAEQIRALAREYHTGLVDSLARFKECLRDGKALESFLSQSNHPNRAGHEIVATELLKWFP